MSHEPSRRIQVHQLISSRPLRSPYSTDRIFREPSQTEVRSQFQPQTGLRPSRVSLEILPRLRSSTDRCGSQSRRPRSSTGRYGPWTRFQILLRLHTERGKKRCSRFHDIPDNMGKGRHERLRHRTRPAQPRRCPPRRYDPRDSACETHVGPWPDQIHRQGPRTHAPADSWRNYREDDDNGGGLGAPELLDGGSQSRTRSTQAAGHSPQALLCVSNNPLDKAADAHIRTEAPTNTERARPGGSRGSLRVQQRTSHQIRSRPRNNMLSRARRRASAPTRP